jgi:hypothetical protein
VSSSAFGFGVDVNTMQIKERTTGDYGFMVFPA